MKQILIMSSSRMGGMGYLEHAEPQFRALLGDGPQDILFIPYAAVSFSYDKYEEMASTALAKFGYRLTSIHHSPDPRAAVEQASALAVGGGNTFALLKRLYDNSLVEVIRSRVEAGMPYVGWSAGGNIVCPSIRTTNDMPIVEPPTLNALNLIPFQTNPHFISGKPAGHNGESREERLQEFLAINPDEELLALPEGTALYCRGEQATVMGAAGVLWFRQQGKVVLLLEECCFALGSIQPQLMG